MGCNAVWRQSCPHISHLRSLCQWNARCSVTCSCLPCPKPEYLHSCIAGWQPLVRAVKANLNVSNRFCSLVTAFNSGKRVKGKHHQWMQQKRSVGKVTASTKILLVWWSWLRVTLLSHVSSSTMLNLVFPCFFLKCKLYINSLALNWALSSKKGNRKSSWHVVRALSEEADSL